jgi:hypothetical protein
VTLAFANSTLLGLAGSNGFTDIRRTSSGQVLMLDATQVEVNAGFSGKGAPSRRGGVAGTGSLRSYTEVVGGPAQEKLMVTLTRGFSVHVLSAGRGQAGQEV